MKTTLSYVSSSFAPGTILNPPASSATLTSNPAFLDVPVSQDEYPALASDPIVARAALRENNAGCLTEQASGRWLGWIEVAFWCVCPILALGMILLILFGW